MATRQQGTMGASSDGSRLRAGRGVVFAAALGAVGLLFWIPLHLLSVLALEREYYSHIPLIPVIAVILLWRGRDDVFRNVEFSPKLGALFLTAALILEWMANRFAYRLGENDSLSIAIAGFVVAVWGTFLLCYGRRALRAGLFPLAFLLLMAPIPEFVRARLVSGLQQGSAELCAWLFKVSGVPFFREKLIFTLPGVKIEVAEACSGIRSTIALFITTLLAGHLFLRSVRKEVLLLLALLPVVIFKNAVRIVTLTLLGVHVNPAFLHGELHRDGGFLFFLLGMALLAPLFFWLRRTSNQSRPAASS